MAGAEGEKASTPLKPALETPVWSVTGFYGGKWDTPPQSTFWWRNEAREKEKHLPDHFTTVGVAHYPQGRSGKVVRDEVREFCDRYEVVKDGLQVSVWVCDPEECAVGEAWRLGSEGPGCLGAVRWHIHVCINVSVL